MITSTLICNSAVKRENREKIKSILSSQTFSGESILNLLDLNPEKKQKYKNIDLKVKFIFPYNSPMKAHFVVVLYVGKYLAKSFFSDLDISYQDDGYLFDDAKAAKVVEDIIEDLKKRASLKLSKHFSRIAKRNLTVFIPRKVLMDEVEKFSSEAGKKKLQEMVVQEAQLFLKGFEMPSLESVSVTCTKDGYVCLDADFAALPETNCPVRFHETVAINSNDIGTDLQKKLSASSEDAVVLELVQLMCKALKNRMPTIPVEVSGPYTIRSKVITAFFPKQARYGLVKSVVETSDSSEVYILTMTDKRKYLQCGSNYENSKILPISALKKLDLASMVKEIDQAAKQYLLSWGIPKDAISIYLRVEGHNVYDCMSCKKYLKNLDFRICVIQDGKWNNKGVVVRKNDIAEATRNAFDLTLKDKMTEIRTNVVKNWYENDYPQLSFYDRYVLFAMQHPRNTYRFDNYMTAKVIKDTLSYSYAITPSGVADSLKRLQQIVLRNPLNEPIILSFQSTGKYGKYSKYALSEVFKKYKIWFDQPIPEKPADVFEFSNLNTKRRLLISVATQRCPFEDFMNLIQAAVDKKETLLFKKFILSPEGKSVLSQYSDSERMLIKCTLENISGLKNLAKCLSDDKKIIPSCFE